MKFGQISEDVRDVIEEEIGNYGLENYMNIFMYSVEKQKTVVSVSKLNPLGEAVSKKSNTIVICVVEDIFTELNPNQQHMLVQDCLNRVKYDDEKDKITIEPPTITMSAAGWTKYGAELAATYKLCMLTAQQIEEKKAEEKAAAKEAKKRKSED